MGYKALMFSGIIEAKIEILEAQAQPGLLRVHVTKPEFFNDIKTGDSIACNGVCLTLESFDDKTMVFALAAETLKVLRLEGATTAEVVGQVWNAERSLGFGDRIHGHLVTGHVDSLGEVIKSYAEGESWMMTLRLQDSALPFVWKKGSLTIHGVSLTLNEVDGRDVQVCLIPETQKRTNLTGFKVGSYLNIEPDYMAKAVVRAQQLNPDLRRST
jgi:riboflavin synthase